MTRFAIGIRPEFTPRIEHIGQLARKTCRKRELRHAGDEKDDAKGNCDMCAGKTRPTMSATINLSNLSDIIAIDQRRDQPHLDNVFRFSPCRGGATVMLAPVVGCLPPFAKASRGPKIRVGRLTFSPLPLALLEARLLIRSSLRGTRIQKAGLDSS
jgi:hypothetical protein